MQITRQSSKRRVSTIIMILLCMCVNIACVNTDSKKSGEEIEYLDKEGVLGQDVRKTEDVENEVSDEKAEQAVFIAENLPKEIKILLNYENWMDDTQVILCTEDDIKNTGMPEVFQQIINGDFSNVQGLRNEEEREEMKKEYERRESWAYMTRDIDGDGIDELCMKDCKGRMGICFEVWRGTYMPGKILNWSFGEHESNLLMEKDWGSNDYFLKNGQFAMMFKSSNGSNTYYNLSICYLGKYGTFSPIEEMKICIINDIYAGNGINYEIPGIYYKIDRGEGYEEVTEQESIAWCEDKIYPYMMSEKEWYAVP